METSRLCLLIPEELMSRWIRIDFPGVGGDVVHLPRALRIGDKFFDVMVQPGFYLLRRCGTDTQDPALKTAAAREGRLLVISDSDERDAKPYEGWDAPGQLHGRRHRT